MSNPHMFMFEKVSLLTTMLSQKGAKPRINKHINLTVTDIKNQMLRSKKNQTNNIRWKEHLHWLRKTRVPEVYLIANTREEILLAYKKRVWIRENTSLMEQRNMELKLKRERESTREQKYFSLCLQL